MDEGDLLTHYNYFRNFDPSIGRYVQSDPIGLAAGLNTYRYADGSPLKKVDLLGLAVSGSWMKSPAFNLLDWGIDSFEIVSPTWSWWGYLKFIRAHGHADGFINVDVKCTDDCGHWEIHNRVNVNASGSKDFGPNLYAFALGTATGSPLVGGAATLLLGGADLLLAEQHFLQLANDKAGKLIATIMKYGPTAMCVGAPPITP
jgi:RHS repeat-associated protein